MELMEMILSDENLEEAIRRVKRNRGAAGVDGMKTEDLDDYFAQHKETIRRRIMNMQYRPMPVRRVYIPKPNGKQRPLGIPAVVDRVVQQAVAQVLSKCSIIRTYDKNHSQVNLTVSMGMVLHTKLLMDFF